MKISMGNFGNSLPEVVQRPNPKEALGAGIMQAAAQVAERHQAFLRARAANQMTEYETSAKEASQDITRRVNAGELDDDAGTEELEKQLAALKPPDEKGLDEITRENLRGGINASQHQARRQYGINFFARQQDRILAETSGTIESLRTQAGMPGADPVAINSKGRALAQSMRAGGMSEVDIESSLSKFEAANFQDSAIGYLRANPTQGLALLATPNSGDPRFDRLTGDQRRSLESFGKGELATQIAKRVVDIYRDDARAGTKELVELSESGLDPEVLEDARAKIREGVGLMHAERRQQFNEQATALERSISQDNPGANAEGQAASLYRRGAYSAEQYTNVLQAIDEARIRGAKKRAELVLVQDAILNGKRLDPRDEKVVKAVDSWFTENTATNGIAPGTEEWVNSAAAIAARTNVLPPEAMSWARKNLLSGDPAMSVPAANAIARFSDAAPAAYAFWDDPLLKANAEHVDGMVRAGVPPAKAVELARSITFDIPKARQDALQADYGKQKYAADNAGELKSFMDSDDNFDRTVFGGSPAPSIGMQDEFNAQVRRYFDYTNGDINRARNLAWQDLRGTYGVSTVNGAPQVLKYAPELIFPGIDPTVIRHDIDAAAASRNIKTPVMLTPSRATGDTHGVLWNLTTVDEDGNAELLLDDKNRPLQYAIPTDTQTYLEAADNAKRAAVEGARAESKKRREIAESMADLGSFPGY